MSLQMFLERQGQVVVFLKYFRKTGLRHVFLNYFRKTTTKSEKKAEADTANGKQRRRRRRMRRRRGRREDEDQEECKQERVMKKTWKEKRMKTKRWNDVEECHPRYYSFQRACRPQPNRLSLSFGGIIPWSAPAGCLSKLF